MTSTIDSEYARFYDRLPLEVCLKEKKKISEDRESIEKVGTAPQPEEWPKEYYIHTVVQHYH